MKTRHEPPQLAPMLAGATGVPRRPQEYLYEPKWDGVRAISTVTPAGVVLRSRLGRDITASYPEVGALAHALDVPAVLDGEIVAFGEDGSPSFQRLQRRMHVAFPTPPLVAEVPVLCVVFDLLWLDGDLLIGLPQQERRRLLDDRALRGSAWATTPLLSGTPEELLAVCRKTGFEGYMAKRCDAPYTPGRRSPAWSKVKCGRRRDFVVAGWAPGKGARSSTIGSLALGCYDIGREQADQLGRPQRLFYVGQAGSGLTEEHLVGLAARFRREVVTGSPFVNPPRVPQLFYVPPTSVVEVAYSDVTEGGTLRQPSIKGFRNDIDPRDVVVDDELAARHGS